MTIFVKKKLLEEIDHSYDMVWNDAVSAAKRLLCPYCEAGCSFQGKSKRLHVHWISELENQINECKANQLDTLYR